MHEPSPEERTGAARLGGNGHYLTEEAPHKRASDQESEDYSGRRQYRYAPYPPGGNDGLGRKETIGWATIAALGSFVLAWITITGYLQGQIDRTIAPLKDSVVQMRTDSATELARIRLDINAALTEIRREVQDLRVNPGFKDRLDGFAADLQQLTAHVEWWRQNGVSRSERLEMLKGIQTDIDEMRTAINRFDQTLFHAAEARTTVQEQVNELRSAVRAIERRLNVRTDQVTPSIP
jgi:hypothetical protein